jgi:hypothetical protein
MGFRMKKIFVGLLIWLLAACQSNVAPPVVETPTSASSAAPTEANAPGFGQDVAIPNEGAAHVAEGSEITYAHNPPASGTHYPAYLQYGLYEEPNIPPGYWVHNLEHGAIVILYQCPQSCPDLVEQLGNLLDQFRLSKWDNRKIVIVPYDDMDVPLMAIAWDVQMSLDQLDAQALLDFYDRHVDQGPEDIP